MKERRFQWIDSYYNSIESDERQRRKKPHRLSRTEFLRGMNSGKCNRISEGTGESDGDLLDGEMEEQDA